MPINIKYIVIFVIFIFLIFIAYNFYETNNKIDQSNYLENSQILPTILTDQKIPKIIIQTWKNDTVPQRYVKLINTIKETNPDYEYKFFTDETIEVFFKQFYPEYYNTYLNLPVKIQRIDFFRYVAVYHFGGFYMDLDMRGIKPLDDLLHYDCVFPIDELITKQMCNNYRYKPFCDKGYYYLLGQYAFGARPKHPFIKLLIENIHQKLYKLIKNIDLNSEHYVYNSTGPDYVTNAYINYSDNKDIFILNNGKRQYFGDYAQHHFFGTWKVNPNN